MRARILTVMAMTAVWAALVGLVALLIVYVCYRIVRVGYRVGRVGYRMGRMSGQVQPGSISSPGRARVLARMHRRALLDLLLSLLMLVLFALGWLFARLPPWFAVLGILLVIQALGYTAFVHRMGLDLAAWRRDWPHVMAACALWSGAVVLVVAQLSVALAIGWLVLAVLGLGFMLRVYVGLRRRQQTL